MHLEDSRAPQGGARWCTPWAAAALAAVSLGCGQGPAAPIGEPSPQELQAAELELRVSPTDTERLARLTVQLPTGTCGPGGSCARPLAALPRLVLDTTVFSLGTEVRVLPGKHVLQVDEALMEVELKPEEVRTMVLSVARRKCAPERLPTVTDTHFGSSVSLANAACPGVLTAPETSVPADPLANGRTLELFFDSGTNRCGNVYLRGTLAQLKSANCSSLDDRVTAGFRVDTDPPNVCRTLWTSSRGACQRLAAGNVSDLAAGMREVSFADTDRALPPGEYSLGALGAATNSTKVNLTEGLIVEVPIALPVIGVVPPTFKTTIAFAEPRELPDLAGASITSSVSGERGYSLPARATETLQLVAFQNPAATYSLNVGGRKVTLDQSRDNTITLRRLDVDHVRVTREDGSVYMQPANFEIFFGGTRVAAGTTNSGLDMLPGEYELVLSYKTAEGPRVQRQTIKL